MSRRKRRAVRGGSPVSPTSHPPPRFVRCNRSPVPAAVTPDHAACTPHVSAHRAATHPSTPSLASGPRPPQCPPLPAPMCQPESAARPNAGGRTAGQRTVGARADGWQARRRLHRTYTGRHLHPAHAASPWPAVRHMTSPKRTRSGDLMPMPQAASCEATGLEAARAQSPPPARQPRSRGLWSERIRFRLCACRTFAWVCFMGEGGLAGGSNQSCRG